MLNLLSVYPRVDTFSLRNSSLMNFYVTEELASDKSCPVSNGPVDENEIQEWEGGTLSSREYMRAVLVTKEGSISPNYAWFNDLHTRCSRFIFIS